MAVTPDKVQIGTSQDFLDGVAVDTDAGTGLFRETVVLADPENGGGLANVRDLGTQLLMTDKGVVTNTIIHGKTAQGNIVDIKANPSGALAVDASGSTFTDANQTGAWAYSAGVSGTVAIAAGRKVLQITATAGLTAASLTINGGASITIPIGKSLCIEPKGNLVAPTIVFTSTAAYFVESVL